MPTGRETYAKNKLILKDAIKGRKEGARITGAALPPENQHPAFCLSEGFRREQRSDTFPRAVQSFRHG
jgi:hypothetical protein